MFFDACDGIFLNYNWNDKCLKHSKELASSRGRPMDVYVGVDVFGRGCLGGGGFNTVEVTTQDIPWYDRISIWKGRPCVV